MTIGPQKLGPYWLIGATTFSRIGTLAYTVVMTWAVSKAGGNNSVGWVNATAGFTIVLVGISATTWLDKFDKRTCSFYSTPPRPWSASPPLRYCS